MDTQEVLKDELRDGAELCIATQDPNWWSASVLGNAAFHAAESFLYASDQDAESAEHAATFLLLVAESL